MYPICIGLEYRILGACRIRGCGHTLFLSSSSITFETDAALPTGSQIELALNWPVRLEQNVGLQLCIRGRTADVAGNYATVRINRYEFRTRAPGGARIGHVLDRRMVANRV